MKRLAVSLGAVLLLALPIAMFWPGQGPQSTSPATELDRKVATDSPAEPPPSRRLPTTEDPADTSREERLSVEASEIEKLQPINRLIVFGDVPDDPVEAGQCTLQLLLLDRATGRGIPSKIDLWRLDAPDNSEWTRGDQLQLQTDIPAEGRPLEGLPEGEYRVVAHAESSDRQGSLPIALRSPGNALTVYVDLPELRPAFLKLYDANGRLIREALASYKGSGQSPVANSVPDWVRRRTVKDPNKSSVHGGGAGGGFSGRYVSRRSEQRVAGPLGFELGPFLGDSREGRRTDRIRFQHQGFGDVLCTVKGADREHRTYVGVLIRPSRILHTIRLPDGTSADSFPEAVTVESGTILEAEAQTGAPWREAPISVSVRKPGFKHISFSFRLDDEPLETRVLRPDKQDA